MLPTRFHSLPLILGVLLIAALPMRAQVYGVPDTSKFEIHNLESFNTDADDYAPYIVPTGKWFYFTNNHDGSANLFRAPEEGDGWGAPAAVTTPAVNTPTDEGTFSASVMRHALLFKLSADDIAKLSGSYYGLVTVHGRADSVGDADLQIANLSPDGAEITSLQTVFEVNSLAWDAQGTVAPDGSYIVFSSDRDGGEGGMDLYMAHRNPSGGFEPPVNMGTVLNTSGNEFSPYLAPDGRTLFFSSTGLKGYGGADIFVSRRDGSGNWGTPKNLGPKINTSSNELFFFSVDQEHCYFTSDRSGGKGRLDLYEGGPNIFVSGYAKVAVQIIDTTTGRRIPGHVVVRERELSRVACEGDVYSGRNAAEFLVVSNLDYTVTANAPGFGEKSITIADIPFDNTVECIFKFGSVPPAPPITAVPIEMIPPPEPPPIALPPVPFVYTFEADGTIVPFFVSGYYRLNTRTSLVELRKRQGADLATQTYIANVNRDQNSFVQNQRYADKVEKLLGDFIRMCEESYFPDFITYNALKRPNDPKEYIQLTVFGFADPRPIIGAYSEAPITFLDSTGKEVTVRSWERLDNFKLAGLRAYYAVEYFDKIFRRSRARKEYLSLLQQGLIRWRAVSGSVDDLNAAGDAELLGTKRRIIVDARLLKVTDDPSSKSGAQ